MTAHGGIRHWWYQRLSALILIPLTIWLLWAIMQLTGADYSAALGFFASPVQRGFAILLICFIAFHAQIGMQVVYEDYVQPPYLQSALIWLTRAGVTLGFILTIYALLNLPGGT